MFANDIEKIAALREHSFFTSYTFLYFGDAFGDVVNDTHSQAVMCNQTTVGKAHSSKFKATLSLFVFAC